MTVGATEAELCEIENEYDAYVAWITEQGLESTAGTYSAWAGLRDRGVNAQGLLGGAPW